MDDNDSKEPTVGGNPVVEFAREVAQQLPVQQAYNEAASPAVKQAGEFFEDLVKTVRLALAPIQFLAAYQDRVRHFIDRSVRVVPEAQRVPPAPQILGPVLEGIRYEPEDTPIDKMFSSLLTASMDSKRVGDAHPAFPQIIRQLSSDEAILLKRLGEKPFALISYMEWDQTSRLFGPSKYEFFDVPTDDLHFPQNASFR